jgi:hypothetical protein
MGDIANLMREAADWLNCDSHPHSEELAARLRAAKPSPPRRMYDYFNGVGLHNVVGPYCDNDCHCMVASWVAWGANT